MTDAGIVILGIPIPSSRPAFLAIVAAHVVVGFVGVIAGAVAMLSPKRAGRHPTAGSVYYWSLVLVVASMGALAIIRWPMDNHLFALGLASLLAATIGRLARRRRRLRLHVVGMGLAYVLLLTAFYIDNGPHLPLWKLLPSSVFWIAPSAVGLPLIARALLRHPLFIDREYKH